MKAFIDPQIHIIPLADIVATSGGGNETVEMTFDVQPNPIWDDSPDKHFE